MKWKHFPRYWPFVRGIHRSPVNSQHKAQWRGALMFSLICAWINGWANNHEAADLRRHRAHYDVTVCSADCTVRHASFPRILDFQQVFVNHTTFSKWLSRLECSHNQNQTTKQNKTKHYMSVKTSQITGKSVVFFNSVCKLTTIKTPKLHINSFWW